MMQRKQDSVSGAAQAIHEYDGLLRRIEESTDELLSAVQSWDVEKVENLIEAREELCRKVGPCIRNLEGASGSPGSQDLVSTSNLLQARQDRLLKKQAECESALSAGLDRCKAALMSLNQRRDLRDRYRGPTTVERARFLDSKL